MNNNNNNLNDADGNNVEAANSSASGQNTMDALSQYFKSAASIREGRAIPPLDKWHPTEVVDMDLIIKANGEWWHEGAQMTRESLVNLFATILWKEDNNHQTEYFLKTPAQKIRIQVEDVPLFINDVGIVHENEVSWLEFTTTTGDVVRLDNEHPIMLKAYQSADNETAANKNAEANAKTDQASSTAEHIRPYMSVRNGLTALIGRNTFYHLTEIGQLSEENDETILTLQSGGQSYSISMPSD